MSLSYISYKCLYFIFYAPMTLIWASCYSCIMISLSTICCLRLYSSQMNLLHCSFRFLISSITCSACVLYFFILLFRSVQLQVISSGRNIETQALQRSKGLAFSIKLSSSFSDAISSRKLLISFYFSATVLNISDKHSCMKPYRC